MTYKIVADSTSNVMSLEKIDFSSVPMKIVTDVKEYVDDNRLNTEEMVADLKAYKGRSGTSCPSIGEWEEAFGDADVVFGVTITSALSGSYGAAMEAKKTYEENHPSRKVHIIDSLTAGPEMELIIEKLQQLMLDGKSFETIREEITAYTQRTHTLFSLESLKNLANNGRINHAVATAAGLLGIRVVGKGSDKGTLELMHKCRGEKKAMETLFAEMKKMGFKGGKVRISHCFNLNATQSLIDLIRKEFAQADIKFCDTTGLCSFYAEKGGLILGFES